MSDYFNQSVMLEVPPDLQPERLQQVVQELLLHHDTLRSQFVQEGQRWQQFKALENLSPNLSPTRGEALNSPPTLVGKGVGGLGFALAFPYNVKSQIQEPIPFSVIDLSHLSAEEQQTAIKAADAELQASLNLSPGDRTSSTVSIRQ